MIMMIIGSSIITMADNDEGYEQAGNGQHADGVLWIYKEDSGLGK